jgi:cell division protein FtsB
MTDHEKPAWKIDDQIEAIAWQLETAMASINKDPRAALLKGLEKVRLQFLAEMDARWAKFEAEMRAKREAEFAKQDAELAEWAQWRAQRKAEMEKLDEEWAAIQRMIAPHALLH